MTTLVKEDGSVREMQLKDAKATLSSVVTDVQHGGEVVITRHGKKTAVVVSWNDWVRLSQIPSFARLLMASPLAPGDIPDRDVDPMRDAGL